MKLIHVLENEELEETLTEKVKISVLKRLDYNTTLANVVNLLLITSGKTKHCTAYKNLPRLLESLNLSHNGVYYFNMTHNGVYHFCMNCLNSVPTALAGHSKIQTVLITIQLRQRYNGKNKAGRWRIMMFSIIYKF